MGKHRSRIAVEKKTLTLIDEIYFYKLFFCLMYFNLCMRSKVNIFCKCVVYKSHYFYFETPTNVIEN